MNKGSSGHEPRGRRGFLRRESGKQKIRDVPGICFGAEQISIQNNFSNVSDPTVAEAYKTYISKANRVPPLKPHLPVTCFLQEFAHHPRGHRSQLAGLGYHSVASSDRWSHLPGQQVEGQIPGTDQTS